MSAHSPAASVLSRPESRVLAVVQAAPAHGVVAQWVADVLHLMDVAAVTNTLEALVRRGHLTRRIEPRDRGKRAAVLYRLVDLSEAPRHGA